jgi:hypothetical protein
VCLGLRTTAASQPVGGHASFYFKKLWLPLQATALSDWLPLTR